MLGRNNRHLVASLGSSSVVSVQWLMIAAKTTKSRYDAMRMHMAIRPDWMISSQLLDSARFRQVTT